MEDSDEMSLSPDELEGGLRRSSSSGNSQGIYMRPVDTRLRGRIMLTILGECKTTTQITYETGEDVLTIRPHLIRLHHLGIIEPVAVRYEEDNPESNGYFDDLVWGLTIHGREHSISVAGCYGCDMRELLMLVDAGFYE